MNWRTAAYEVDDGKHRFEWIYNKISEPYVSDDLSAEIEFIQVSGVRPTVRNCQQCLRGVPNADQSRCIPCEQDRYLDPETASCRSCPNGYYAPDGAIGEESCLERPPCEQDDVHFEFTECVDGKRDKIHTLRKPQVCYEPSDGYELPDKIVGLPCKGCGRGTFRNEEGLCEKCALGTF
jgi:hypothetical protein